MRTYRFRVLSLALALLAPAAGAGAGFVRSSVTLGAPRMQVAPTGGSPAESVAVIPFTNISGREADDWIGDGIAETVTTDLESQARFAVIGRERVQVAAAGRGLTLDDSALLELGRALGARWVVAGGYQRIGDQLRITARLVDTADGTVARTLKADGTLDQLFDLQDQIARELTTDLGSNAMARAATPRMPAPGLPAGGNGEAAAPIFTRDADGRPTVRAVRVTEPLRIDGRLDEAVYRTVPPISEFVQTLPNELGEPTERTEAWVMFDDRDLYVSVRCWDSAPPEQWVADVIQRDATALGNNDNFAVLFDTFHDRRNAVGFLTNPLGAVFDFAITDEGNLNREWNTVWEVQTSRFEGGWTIEMAIPFKSFRYVAGPNQTWGIQMRRGIKHKNEWIYLAPLPRSVGGNQGIFRVSAQANLVGLDLPRAGKNVEIKPYGIARVSTDRLSLPPVSGDGDGNAGVDVKVGITSSLTADITYNTDFAQVEVDEQQVNLTRFSLFFPEKRDFFLEGRGIFEFGRGSTIGGGAGRRAGGGQGPSGSGDATPYLFYSRRVGLNSGRVVPIDVGGRLTGKVGGFSLGVLNVHTRAETASESPATAFTVVRVKRDILGRSSIGAMLTNRSHAVAAPGSNQAYGVDGLFSFFQDLNLGGYYARTETPGLENDDASYQGRFSYGGDRYGAQLEYVHVGDNFNPEIGFLRRDNFNRTFGLLRFSPRPRSSRFVRRYLWETSLEYIEDGAGALETRQQTGRFNVEFESGDQFGIDARRETELLEQPFEISQGVAIAAGGYTFSDVQLTYRFGQQRRASGRLSVQSGHFYDGTITAVTYSAARVSLTPQLSVEPTVSVNHVELPAGDFVTRLIRMRADYGVSPRMAASALVQYSSAERALSSNLRFRWEYGPGSELFVVYTDERDTYTRGFPGLKNRTFVVKVNRLLRF